MGSPTPRGVMECKILGDVSRVRELNIHYVLTLLSSLIVAFRFAASRICGVGRFSFFFVLHAAIYLHCYLDDGEKLLAKIEARIHLASIDLTIFATIKRIGHV